MWLLYQRSLRTVNQMDKSIFSMTGTWPRVKMYISEK